MIDVTRQMCAAGRMGVSMGVVEHLGAGQMDSVVVQLSSSTRCVRTIDCVVMLIDVTRQMCAAGRMGHSKGLVAHLLVVGAGAWHGGMMRCDSDLTITSVPASRDATIDCVVLLNDATPYR